MYVRDHNCSVAGLYLICSHAESQWSQLMLYKEVLIFYILNTVCFTSWVHAVVDLKQWHRVSAINSHSVWLYSIHRLSSVLQLMVQVGFLILIKLDSCMHFLKPLYRIMA